MWNPNSMTADSIEEDESWEVKAFAEDTGNAMGTTWPPRSYTCTFCRREFRSAQALGGHMNVHRRDRARLHQTQLNLKNPNQELVPATDGGLCLLFSLPNPNAVFKSSSLNINPTIASYPRTNNFVNFPAVVAAPHNSFSYNSISNSSNNEASSSIDHVISLDNMKKKTDLAVEDIDLELRLGCSSSGS